MYFSRSLTSTHLNSTQTTLCSTMSIEWTLYLYYDAHVLAQCFLWHGSAVIGLLPSRSTLNTYLRICILYVLLKQHVQYFNHSLVLCFTASNEECLFSCLFCITPTFLALEESMLAAPVFWTKPNAMLLSILWSMLLPKWLWWTLKLKIFQHNVSE